MKKILNNWCARYLSEPEAVFLTIFLIISLLIISWAGSKLAPITASVIIAYMLNGFVERLKKWRVPHLLAVTIVCTIFISALILILIWLLPILIQQIINLFSNTPQIFNRIQNFFLSLQHRYPEIINTEKLKYISSELAQSLTKLGQFFLSFSLASIGNIITLTIYLVLMPLLVFFFLKDKQLIISWLNKFLPVKRKALKEIYTEIDYKIGDYIRGKIIEIIIVTIISLTFFGLMGLDYAILLGIGVGISSVIPYIGAVIITFPVIIIGFLQWDWSLHLLYLVIGYAIILVLDGNVLVPVLFSEKMQLHPITIIVALLIFGNFWGFWGIFFAIPLATVFNILLKKWPNTTIAPK